jgi:nitrate/nitrite transporter NarK
MGPLWTIPSESLPRKSMGLVVGLVNACGNLGGFAGPYIAGWLTKIYHSTSVAFVVLGLTLLVAAGLAFLLPKPAPQVPSLA